MAFQTIFTQKAVDYLSLSLKNPEGDVVLSEYNRESVAYDPTWMSTSRLEVPDDIIELAGDYENDIDNSIKIFRRFKLNRFEASDPRLWTFLCHVQFRSYALSRWNCTSISQISEHWFVETTRGLGRNSVARLWWGAKLTYAPWLVDPVYFKGLEFDDDFQFTRVLFQTQDIFQALIERGMGRSYRIIISVLDYLRCNIEFAADRFRVRNLIKALNQCYGATKITHLNRKQLSDLVCRLAGQIGPADVGRG